MKSTEQFQQLINEGIDKFCKEQNGQPIELYEPIKYILSLGGKRMRPLLTLLACDLFDGNVNDALNASLAIELFHNFTLVHDDIMDQAPVRRNKPSVHHKWNPNIAILSGDAMLVKAYQLICNTGLYPVPSAITSNSVSSNITSHLISNPINLSPEKKLEVLQLFNEIALLVCEGQQLDMNYEKLPTVTISQYIKMTERKTAALLAGSLKIGAIIGGAKSEDANRLYEFGKNIGIAFQLQDDILDVYGDEKKFGKQKGGDIISNKKTFLLLKALELSKINAYKKEELQQWIHASVAEPSQKVEAITAIYDFLNVRKLAEDEMMSYYNKGLHFLNEIPANENKKGNLLELVGSLINREV